MYPYEESALNEIKTKLMCGEIGLYELPSNILEDEDFFWFTVDHLGLDRLYAFCRSGGILKNKDRVLDLIQRSARFYGIRHIFVILSPSLQEDEDILSVCLQLDTCIIDVFPYHIRTNPNLILRCCHKIIANDEIIRLKSIFRRVSFNIYDPNYDDIVPIINAINKYIRIR